MNSATEKIDKDEGMKQDIARLQKSMLDLTKAFESLSSGSRTYDKKSSTTEHSVNTEQSSKMQDQKPKRKRYCYNCGAEDHIRPDCPKRSKVFHNKSVKDKGNVAATGSGLYGDFKVNGILTEFLIDTGASLTLISTRVWEHVKESCVSELRPYSANLQTASGECLVIRGKATMTLEICGIQIIAEVAVADIELDAILGLDVMKANNCSIDLTTNKLSIKGKTCKLSVVGKMGCYRITVSQKVEIPSMSEMIIDGDVSIPGHCHVSTGLLEPVRKNYSTERPMVARTLVEGSNKVPVRVMNLSTEMQVLHPGTHIANFNKVASVENVKQDAVHNACSTTVPDHLVDLYNRTVEGMSEQQANEVANLLTKYASTFSENDSDLGRTGIISHKIPTNNSRPIKQPLRRVPVHMREEVDNHVDEMLSKGIIRPSKSPWSSGIVMVTKKDGTKRFCVDYRRVNDVTVKDAYPLPRIDQSLDQLSGSQWFSCLDLNSGYWQIEVDEADKEKTAFSTRQGLYEFNFMPFGLCNAPATFERLMETVLAGLNWQICLVYLDDVIVTGKTFEDMVSNLSQVLDRLQNANLKLKPRKCQLFGKRVEFLGYVVSENGLQTDPKKTTVVRNWPTPVDVRDVRSFIGFCSYYRKFIKGFSEIAKPLFCLTEKNTKFNWSNDCRVAFETLKRMLVEAPVLAHPDFTKPFLLDTDASDVAVGGVLSQIINGEERVIAYASRTLTKAEKKYCVTRKELLAVVEYVKYFRHYLYGKKFTIRSDHGSLRWLMNFKNPEGQVARWLEVLAAYEFEIQHRPGRQHRNADGLSRINCRQCGMAELSQGLQNEDRHNVNTLYDQNHADLGVVDIKTAQASDSDICKMKDYFSKGVRPDRSEICERSYFFKSLWNQWQRLDVQDGLLVRKWDVLGTDIVHWQVIVPLSQRRQILKHAHDTRISGHLGIKKTLSKIRQRYYWPGCQSDVRTYVSGCEICLKRKQPTKTKKAPMQVVRSGYPMERIGIDILGELPVTENGNKYILVVSDYFTKWTECFPMHNMEARVVADILVTNVICRFGVPDDIHSDQGRQFTSELFMEMCKILHIDKTRTTPYHPESDGMVERFNRTLCAMLSAFVNDHHTDWDVQLPYVMMAYRSSEHETTGFTPNLCMLGREFTTPLDLMYEMPPVIKPIPLNQWVWELREGLENAHKVVRQNTGEAMSRQKRYHDGKLSFESYQVGDKVYVFFPVKKIGCSSKLTSYWRGPHVVNAKLSDVLYRVDCGRAGGDQVIHCDRMRKSKSQILQGEEPILEDDDQDDADGRIADSGKEAAGCPCPDDPAFEVDFSRGKRERNKPVWMKDYVLSLFRETDMPNTKVTERKAKLMCPKCSDTLATPEEFRFHLDMCLLKAQGCTICHKVFSTKKCLQQHVKRMHPSPEGAKKVLVAQGTEDSREGTSDWEEQSDFELTDEDADAPTGNEVAEEESLFIGRTVCKRTTPSPVPAPVKDNTKQQTVVTDNEHSSEGSLGSPNKGMVTDEHSGEGSVGSPKKRKVELNYEVKVEGAKQAESVLVLEDGEECFKSEVSRRKPDTKRLRLSNIIPEGSIASSSLEVELTEHGVKLLFNYEG